MKHRKSLISLERSIKATVKEPVDPLRSCKVCSYIHPATYDPPDVDIDYWSTCDGCGVLYDEKMGVYYRGHCIPSPLKILVYRCNQESRNDISRRSHLKAILKAIFRFPF